MSSRPSPCHTGTDILGDSQNSYLVHVIEWPRGGNSWRLCLFLCGTQWQYMVLDEAHAIKNSDSLRWKKMLTFNTRNRLLLTGTPIQVCTVFPHSVPVVIERRHLQILKRLKPSIVTVTAFLRTTWQSCGPCCTLSCRRSSTLMMSSMSGFQRLVCCGNAHGCA